MPDLPVLDLTLEGAPSMDVELIGGGENGATYTPAVSPEGELSWSNDKNLQNPEPVNIKGPGGRALTRAEFNAAFQL
jgi:hypothetical protein